VAVVGRQDVDLEIGLVSVCATVPDGDLAIVVVGGAELVQTEGGIHSGAHVEVAVAAVDEGPAEVRLVQSRRPDGYGLVVLSHATRKVEEAVAVLQAHQAKEAAGGKD